MKHLQVEKTEVPQTNIEWLIIAGNIKFSACDEGKFPSETLWAFPGAMESSCSAGEDLSRTAPEHPLWRSVYEAVMPSSTVLIQFTQQGKHHHLSKQQH